MFLQCVAVRCSVLQCITVCLCAASRMRIYPMHCSLRRLPLLLEVFVRTCSVLQRVAARCSVLQCVAMCCSVLQCVAVCCSVLQCDAVCCSVVRVAVCCSVYVYSLAYTHSPHTRLSWARPALSRGVCMQLQRVSACCSLLQCVAVCCSGLQCVAVYACVASRIRIHPMHGSLWHVPLPLEVCMCTCSALQRVAVCCSVLQRGACCSMLQCMCENSRVYTSTPYTTFHGTSLLSRCARIVAVCCSVLQCVAVCCSVLQCSLACMQILHARLFRVMLLSLLRCVCLCVCACLHT